MTFLILGHTYSAYHPLMSQRLKRMDDLAMKVIESIAIKNNDSSSSSSSSSSTMNNCSDTSANCSLEYSDTENVFILLGDHGMTDDGNHVIINTLLSLSLSLSLFFFLT